MKETEKIAAMLNDFFAKRLNMFGNGRLRTYREGILWWPDYIPKDYKRFKMQLKQEHQVGNTSSIS